MKNNFLNRVPEDSCNGDIAGSPVTVRDLQGSIYLRGIFRNDNLRKTR